MRALTDRVFDVLVIGGGLAGASVARDCAMRRLSVLVVEKEEVGSGWTDILTGLLLPDLSLLTRDRDHLFELCTEVGVLLGIAPNLMEPVPLICAAPPQASLAERNRYRALFSAYDRFRSWKGTHSHTELNAEHVPLLDAALNRKLKTVFAWDDWQVHPGRLCVRTLKSAEACGTVVATHHTAEKIQLHNRRVAGVWIRTGEGMRLVRARAIVNAAGAFVRKFYPAQSTLHQGKYQGGMTALWERRMSAYGVIPQPLASSAEAFLPTALHHRYGVLKFDLAGGELTDALIELMFNRMLEKLTPIYPAIHRHRLLAIRTAVSWQPQRTDLAFFCDHSKEDHQGLFSVLPHPELEARLVAEKITDRICSFLRHRDLCRTHLELLSGCSSDSFAETTRPSTHTTDPVMLARLVHRYGHHANTILDSIARDPALGNVVCDCEQVTAAELKFCRENEWANTLSALILRTGGGRGNCDGARCLPWFAMSTGKLSMLSVPHRPLVRFSQLPAREYVESLFGFSSPGETDG
jgi:glycerol-3-phosphate dehydrogenase